MLLTVPSRPTDPDDPLLLFPPEVQEETTIAQSRLEEPRAYEAQDAPPHRLTRAQERSPGPIDVAPPVSEPKGVRQVGVNVSPIGFLFGVAVGAFGMWIFSVPPPLQVITAAAHAVPMAPAPVAQAPANDDAVSVETPPLVAPSVPTSAIAPAVPAQTAVGDAVDREESAATAPRRASDLRREASSEDTPSMPFRGSLMLYSGPPGARAFVDGRAVGSTPVVLSGLPVGSRVVRLEADGYQTWSAAIRVIANQQTRVTATLYREPDSAASQ
jgi:hypothetical protein